MLFSRLDIIADLIDSGIRLKVDLDLVKKRIKSPAPLALYRETLIDLSTFLKEAQAIQQKLKEEQRHRAEAVLDPNSYASGELFSHRETSIGRLIRHFDIPDHHFNPILANVALIVQVAILMMVACSVILRLPRRGCSWLLSMTHFLIQSVVLTLYEDISKAPVYLRLILSQFPWMSLVLPQNST